MICFRDRHGKKVVEYKKNFFYFQCIEKAAKKDCGECWGDEKTLSWIIFFASGEEKTHLKLNPDVMEKRKMKNLIGDNLIGIFCEEFW